MGVITDLLSALKDVSALQAKTNDLNDIIIRLTDKIDHLLDRVTRLEAKHESHRTSVRDEVRAECIERISKLEANQKHLRESVRNQISADIKADMAVLQERLNASARKELEDEKDR